MRQVLYERRGRPTERCGNDMIQLMMDASDQIKMNQKQQLPKKSCFNIFEQNGETKKVAIGQPESGRYLMENELVANCFVFLLAGYETTANCLAFTTFLLAKYPDVQERLYREIVEIYGAKGELKFDDKTMQTEYLDAVINESLRMYPPITG